MMTQKLKGSLPHSSVVIVQAWFNLRLTDDHYAAFVPPLDRIWNLIGVFFLPVTFLQVLPLYHFAN